MVVDHPQQPVSPA